MIVSEDRRQKTAFDAFLEKERLSSFCKALSLLRKQQGDQALTRASVRAPVLYERASVPLLLFGGMPSCAVRLLSLVVISLP
jgi:hypothetical protein